MVNPTTEININFSDYIKERTMKEEKHLEGGIPDYAYASDYALRQKVRSIPGVFPFFKAVLNYQVPLYKQLANMSDLRVTRKQFPRIYEMTAHCAETLGIGMPAVYVDQGVAFTDMAHLTMNACTLATEDADPIILLTTPMVERCTEEELLGVIGHECGHIHNNHGIYNTAVNTFVNQVLNIGGASGYLSSQVLNLLTASLSTALLAWSRAAEVTCDRAACICAKGDAPVSSMMAKFLSGGVLNENQYDIDEIVKQYDQLGTVARINELLGADHPLSVKRILAAKEFVKSEVFYSWNPELKKPNQRLYTKAELDNRCSKFISVLEKEKR